MKNAFLNLPLLCFIFGITASFIWGLDIKSTELSENNLTYDSYELFKMIISNNLIVNLIILLGFLTLGVSSLAILAYNGYIFGICLQSLPLDKILYNFLSYSILESLAFIISCRLALYLSSIVWKNILLNMKLKINVITVIKHTSFAVISTLTASIIEVYVSIN